MYEVLIEFRGGVADAKEYRTKAEALAAYEAGKRRAAASFVALYHKGRMIAQFGAAL
jgi:hypothetical protein